MANRALVKLGSTFPLYERGHGIKPSGAPFFKKKKGFSINDSIKYGILESGMQMEQNVVLKLCFKGTTCHTVDISNVQAFLQKVVWKISTLDASFISWLRTSLWLQFKPHHIAAGAAFLAAKYLNFDLAMHHSGMWQEFQTTPSILQDVVQQLMELF